MCGRPLGLEVVEDNDEKLKGSAFQGKSPVLA